MITTAITTAKAIELFKSIKSSFIGLDICTVTKLSGGKENPHLGKVRKNSTLSALIGSSHDYASKVNKEASAQYAEAFGSTELQPFKAEGLWKRKDGVAMGEHIGGAMVRHKGTDEKYLFYYPTKNTPEVEYTLEGDPIEKSEIIGLPPSRGEGKEVEVIGENGEVEMNVKTKVFPTTLKMSSIKAFRLDGCNFMIID